MKYVLLLSFCYKQFKDKKGELKITLNDRLIDIITLDKDIGLRHVTFTTRDKNGVETKHPLLRTEKMYYYEIDDEDILYEDINRENTLKISVKNDNNNYTNGFMTKDSLLSIENIWFLPKFLFDIGKIEKIRDRLWNGFWKEHNHFNSKRREPNIDVNELPEKAKDLSPSRSTLDTMKEFYNAEYTGLPWFDKAKAENATPDFVKAKWLYYRYHAYTRGLWPGIVHPLEYYDASGNLIKIPNYSKSATIGGSFTVSLPIKKKHKIYSIRQKNYKGPFLNGHNDFYRVMMEILNGAPDYTIINKSALEGSGHTFYKSYGTFM